jgi:hypothetical protein
LAKISALLGHFFHISLVTCCFNGFTLAIGWMDDELSLVEDYFLLCGGFSWLKEGSSC